MNSKVLKRVCLDEQVSRGYNEFGAATVAEDTFKEAAGEIIFWLSS